MGNKVMMIVIIVLLVGLIGLVGFVTVYGLQVLQNVASPEQSAPVTAERALTQRDIDLVKFSDPITSNLRRSPDGRNHTARVTVSIGIENSDVRLAPELIALLEDREPVVRDIISALLREMTYDELTETEDFHGVEVLRQNILNALRVEFGSNLIATVIMEILYA